MGTTDLCYRINILYCEKYLPNPPTASGTYDKEEGRLADEMQVGFEISKILYRLSYSVFYFTYYHSYVTIV